MKSLSIGVGAMVALALTCQGAMAQCTQCQSAGCYEPTICEMFKSGYVANVVWPRQFVPASRRPICQAYAAMVNNGWRRQNLLGDYHFDPDTQELTRAGELKLQWILTQAPVNRRDVYVQRGENVAETATRIATVHGYTARMSPAVGAVRVNDTHIVAEGHSAGSVDNMFIGFQTNQPPPVLPASTGSSVSEN